MKINYSSLLLLTTIAIGGASCSMPSDHHQKKSQAELVTFRGMCDASGAVPLSNRLLMVADDEDNILRVYDAEQGGYPIRTYTLTPEPFGLIPKTPQSKKPKPKKLSASQATEQTQAAQPKKTKSFELDLEAATDVDGISFWLTSHARNSKGKQKLERFHFIGLTKNIEHNGLRFIGKPYTSMLDDLINDPRFAPYQLADASTRAAKAEQSVNIEGMTARNEGGMYIGFRNPVPEGRALVVILKNPKSVILGEPPQFGAPIELDLGGLGVRGLSYWQGEYLIAAGNSGEQTQAALFRWQGENTRPQKLPYTLPADFNPEAFFTPENRQQFMLLSDDGSRLIDNTTCKKLKDASKKEFRGIWLSALPKLAAPVH
jgi:Protein of unknown function (DUF3616)